MVKSVLAAIIHEVRRKVESKAAPEPGGVARVTGGTSALLFFENHKRVVVKEIHNRNI